METPNICAEDLKFPIPSNIIVSGPSHSGKTQLVLKLVENAQEMFSPSPKAIGWLVS
jgi:Ni2+-binding GTPase involved in maturation of urease and hydrogenase